MDVNNMTERSPAIEGGKECSKIFELLSFHYRIISDPHESPSDILSDVVLKIILSPVKVLPSTFGLVISNPKITIYPR